jgi:hypothetical protein
VGKSQPQAPDPSAVAAQQGQWNSFTAQQQQAMNMVGQDTPYGSLAYNQTGSSTLTDPNGKQISVPQFTATQTLSPSQQAIFDQTQSAQGNLATLANDQSSKLQDYMQPFTYNPANDATKWAYDLGSQTILPKQQQDTAALDRQLINRGLRPGSEQYNQQMTLLQQNQGQQLNQLALGGESQAFNEAAYQHSSPLNDINSLISGSQITQPNQTFASTPQSQVAGVDYSGLVNNQFQNESKNYQAGLGGMFGLGGNLLGMGMLKYSDRRLKSEIEKIGTIHGGIPFYEYMIFGRRERGVMADEIEKIMPEAVVTNPNGFKMVRYDMLGLH